MRTEKTVQDTTENEYQAYEEFYNTSSYIPKTSCLHLMQAFQGGKVSFQPEGSAKKSENSFLRVKWLI